EGEVVRRAWDDRQGRLACERVRRSRDRERAGERAGDGLGGDAVGGGGGAEAADGAGAARLREADRGGVVAAFEVAGGVADLDRQRAGVPRGGGGGRVGEGEVIGCSGDDAEGGGVGCERAGAGSDRQRAG